MNFTKHNYEEFILDYIERNLSEKDTFLFEEFLSQNSDIKQEIMGFDNVILPKENIVFEDKYLLKKSDFSEKFDGNYLEELCIADIEKDITNKQKDDLEEIFTGDPEKIAVYNSFKNTKLFPDLDIKYEDKESLKKKQVFLRPSFVYLASSVAASLIIILSVVGLNNRNTYLETKSFSQTREQFENNKTVFEKNIITHDSQIANNNQQFVVSENYQIAENSNSNDNQLDTLMVLDTEVDKIVVSLPKLNQTNKIEITKTKDLQYFDSKDNMILLEAQKMVFDKKKEIEKINAWSIAQVTVNNYNSLTENDINLDGQFDKLGRLKAVSLNTQSFGFYTNKVKRFGISQ